MKNIKYREVSDLDSLFPDGSESYKLSEHLEELVVKVNEFKNKSDSFHTTQDVYDVLMIAELMEYISIVKVHLSEANSFITCLLAQNPRDQKATSLQGKVGSISASFESVVQKTKKACKYKAEFVGCIVRY